MRCAILQPPEGGGRLRESCGGTRIPSFGRCCATEASSPSQPRRTPRAVPRMLSAVPHPPRERSMKGLRHASSLRVLYRFAALALLQITEGCGGESEGDNV